MSIGIWQIIILVAVVAILFSGKKMRNFGADLGTSIKGFKKAIKDEDNTKGIESKEDENVIDAVASEKVVEKDSENNT